MSTVLTCVPTHAIPRVAKSQSVNICFIQGPLGDSEETSVRPRREREPRFVHAHLMEGRLNGFPVCGHRGDSDLTTTAQ